MSRDTLSIILFLLVLSGSFLITKPAKVRAFAKTIIVPDDCPTIGEAVNAASTGDTVFVRSGTYHTNLIIIQTAISLIGEDPKNTILLGGYSGTIIKIVSNGVNVTGLTIGYAGNGYDAASILLENVSECRISENVISNQSRFGIWLLHSSNNEISKNNVTSNTSYGVLLTSSSNNTLVGNTLTYNFGGIQFDNSNYNVLRENSLRAGVSNIGISGSELTDFFNDVDTSNTIEGQPICYFINKQHEIVPENAGYVVVVNSTDILIANLSTTKNEEAILLVQVDNSTIEGNTINYSKYGILGLSSNNNSIRRNSFTSNHISGIKFVSSSNNEVYLNNFFNDPVENSPDSINAWDNGTHGNCWIFWNGDLLNPQWVNVGVLLNASEIDNSGIWNTSYVIDANNVDCYPLVNEVVIPEFPSVTILLSFAVFASPVLVLAKKRARTCYSRPPITST